MHPAIHPAVAAMLVAALQAPPASGQMVYRCGNSYSQTPCPDAAPLRVDDARSPAQQADAKAATAASARLARSLETDRLARERTAPAAQALGAGANAAEPVRPLVKAGNQAKPPARSAKPAKPGKEPSPYFTAAVQGDKGPADGDSGSKKMKKKKKEKDPPDKAGDATTTDPKKRPPDKAPKPASAKAG